MLITHQTADLRDYVRSGEWNVISTRLIRHVRSYPLDNFNYTDITLYVCMNRRVVYYIINIILPCIWLNILSTLQFFLPPEAGEKVS
ncbi:unnamed protein product [Protopolystoma xenopodis]|uniref:Uncharacterized protein n=1 Tax=Protopolystoma xenopodis TaxID=117903 RepID=A0A3S5AFF0_9PLAT|nr:unnamed protein product [Protopolystoma xenopodis]